MVRVRVGRGRLFVPTVSVGGYAPRVVFAFLALAAIALMILSQTQPHVIETMRTGIADAAGPVFDLFSRPAVTVADGLDELDAMLAVHTRNERLRHDNAQLRKWQAVAKQLAHENDALRDLLKAVPDPQAHFVTARVIADSAGPFVHMVLVNAGRSHGVRDGQAVVNRRGLVGRVLEAGEHTSRVLLLKDLNSRVPVIVEASRDRAILMGDNGPAPRLAFLAPDARVKPGDWIVTSGEGGMFPPALAVGVVSSAGEGRATVQPFVVWDRLGYVTILDYVIPGVLPEPRRTGRAGNLR